MKLIIAGSRFAEHLPGVTASKYAELSAALDDFLLAAEVTEVVSGTARGADRLGERWASEHGVSVARFPADWDAHGKSAGYKRNEQMAGYADALLALWDGESRGTKHMIDIARRRGMLVAVVLTRA